MRRGGGNNDLIAKLLQPARVWVNHTKWFEVTEVTWNDKPMFSCRDSYFLPFCRNSETESVEEEEEGEKEKEEEEEEEEKEEKQEESNNKVLNVTDIYFCNTVY